MPKRHQYGPAVKPPSPEAVSATEPLPNTEVQCLKGHDGPVLAVRWNRGGTYCLTCGKDRALRLWNPFKGVLVKSYVGHGHDVRDVCVSKDNSKLASCGGDRSIFQWDVSTGKIIRKFQGHDGDVNSICPGAGEEVLVSGGYDQSVKVWDCRSRNFAPVQAMRAFGDAVMGVAVLPDSPEIVAGSVDCTVRRFDIRLGCLFTDDLAHSVTSVALSNDGNCVLASCMGAGLALLDKAGGDLLAQYKGHKHETYKLDCALTPSDAYVLCGSEDGHVCFWDLVEEAMVLRFAAHQGAVCSLAVHPLGQGLLSASNDGAVKLWQHRE